MKKVRKKWIWLIGVVLFIALAIGLAYEPVSQVIIYHKLEHGGMLSSFDKKDRAIIMNHIGIEDQSFIELKQLYHLAAWREPVCCAFLEIPMDRNDAFLEILSQHYTVKSSVEGVPYSSPHSVPYNVYQRGWFREEQFLIGYTGQLPKQEIDVYAFSVDDAYDYIFYIHPFDQELMEVVYRVARREGY